VLGYIRMKLLVHTTTGEVVAFELEVYVVHGMRVPLLLGEDFQTTDELGVARQASSQCEAFTGQAFLKGKHHIRAHRQLRGSPKDAPPVLARCTVHISLGCIFNVPVDAPFGIQDTWLVKKMLMLDECKEFTSTPTTVISTNNTYIPIANPTERPVMIRKGDVVGHLYDPQEYLDAPCNKEMMVKWAATVEALKMVIKDSLSTDTLSPQASSGREEEHEAWGPKTMAVPEESSVEDVTKAVNLEANIPDEIRPRLEAVL
ncbi:hypothetical protein BDN71DRAFT_1403161, partial [Pleurotus eryngii]